MKSDKELEKEIEKIKAGIENMKIDLKKAIGPCDNGCMGCVEAKINEILEIFKEMGQ